MSEVRIFSYLPVKVPRYRILKRLGYNSRTSEIPAETMQQTDDVIDRTADLISLKAVCLTASTGIVSSWNSSKLDDFLAGSGQLILMGITGGSAVTDELEQLKTSGRLTEAVIIDAAASEIVDEGFNRLAEIYGREFLRESRVLSSRRFSAGYGDFNIRHQLEIHRLLEFDKLGVSITESCMLLPEKSVTAIYGIQGKTNE